jgi:hypothetical protein
MRGIEKIRYRINFLAAGRLFFMASRFHLGAVFAGVVAVGINQPVRQNVVLDASVLTNHRMRFSDGAKGHSLSVVPFLIAFVACRRGIGCETGSFLKYHKWTMAVEHEISEG